MIETLGDRAKQYEAKTESYIPFDQYIIVRIDGRGFSKFTKGFDKPFDENLIYAFKETTKDLISKYNAITAFYQSDEITLVLPPKFKEELVEIKSLDELLEIERTLEGGNLTCFQNDKEYYVEYDNNCGHIHLEIITGYIGDDRVGELDYYNEKWTKESKETFDKFRFYKKVITNNQISKGRVQKLVSTIASSATVSFNRHLDFIIDKNKSSLREKYINNFYNKKRWTAEFDCRIFGVPSKEEVFNMILFRTRDCVRNSKAMFAQTYCSHKDLLNKNTEEMVNFCSETTGQDWNKIEDYKKYGIIIKKELYEKTTEQGKATRTRFIEISKLMTTYNDSDVDMVDSKYYNG